jgi:general stress protein 26
MHTQMLAEIAPDFAAAANAQVWCNVATLDTRSRLRSRVLHPIWEYADDQLIGWIATGRTSLKARHLAHNPHVSLCYLKDPLKPVYAECTATWIDDMAEKQRIWDWFGTTPPPLGYDLAPFFGSVESPGYGLLKLIPWRVELGDLFGQARAWQRA